MVLITFLLSSFCPGGSENEPQAEIEVMTFNVYVAGIGSKSPKNRTDKVITVIRDVLPDSFGLQEADEGWMERLSAGLNEYAHVGTGRDPGGSGEASPIFYLKEKYEALDSGIFWLSETPEIPSKGWGATYRRICTWVILRDIETGFTYAHFNAHLDHLNSNSRKESALLISERISLIEHPVVLTGDFNAEEGSEPYNIITQGLNDTKFAAEESMSGGTYHGYALLDKTTRKKPIDFIFTSNGTGVKGYVIHNQKVEGVYPSDHHAVSAKIVFQIIMQGDSDL